MTGLLAIVVASLYLGAVIYIAVAEQPARLQLDDAALLRAWKPSYQVGMVVLGGAIVAAAVLGGVAYFLTQNWRWLAGAIVIFSIVPYTLIAVLPTNNKLLATPAEQAGPETRAMIEMWGRRHSVRAIMAAVSVLLYLWAQAS